MIMIYACHIFSLIFFSPLRLFAWLGTLGAPETKGVQRKGMQKGACNVASGRIEITDIDPAVNLSARQEFRHMVQGGVLGAKALLQWIAANLPIRRS